MGKHLHFNVCNKLRHQHLCSIIYWCWKKCYVIVWFVQRTFFLDMWQSIDSALNSMLALWEVVNVLMFVFYRWGGTCPVKWKACLTLSVFPNIIRLYLLAGVCTSRAQSSPLVNIMKISRSRWITEVHPADTGRQPHCLRQTVRRRVWDGGCQVLFRNSFSVWHTAEHHKKLLLGFIGLSRAVTLTLHTVSARCNSFDWSNTTKENM